MASAVENEWFAMKRGSQLYAGAHAIKLPATGALMQATGELIRLLNYVDDIAATMRRIHATLPTLTVEEKKRLAEYMRKSDPNFVAVLDALEKGGQ
jgi:hypothetical protein